MGVFLQCLSYAYTAALVSLGSSGTQHHDVVQRVVPDTLKNVHDFILAMGPTLTETSLTKIQRHTRDDKSSSPSILTEQKMNWVFSTQFTDCVRNFRNLSVYFEHSVTSIACFLASLMQPDSCNVLKRSELREFWHSAQILTVH